MLPKDIFIQHTHIGLDIDETLASTIPGLLKFAHESGKLSFLPSMEEITSYDFALIDPALSQEEAYRIWEEYGKITMDPQSLPVVPFAKETIQLLLKKGAKLSVITARSDQESWKVERTKKWIETHFPEIGVMNIAFVNHFSEGSRPKSNACKELGVTLLIDDSIENAYDLSKEGITCILLDKPWNRKPDFVHPLVHRARDWTEIRDNLQIYV